MFFKQEIRDKEKGLRVEVDDLIEQRKFLPYVRQRHNNITSYQAGDIRSAFKGRGMELEEVRSYGYGDDVRDIDWRVTARKGETYTKVFSEEKDREVYVVLDLSPYMLFGTKKELKSVSASKVSALLGWQSIVNKDRFGIIIFDGYNNKIFKPQNNQKHLMTIFKNISDVHTEILSKVKRKDIEKTTKDFSDTLRLLQYSIKGKAMVFVISDYNNISENTKRTLVALSRRAQLYCINIYDTIEESAPYDGKYIAEYNGEKVVFDTYSKEFKDIYHQYFMKKRKEMESFCKRIKGSYINIRTDIPLYEQLKIL